MIETIDPLHGIELHGAYVLKARVDYPDLHVLAGDRLIVHAADTAEPGQMVVATVDGRAMVRRFEEGAVVVGLVVGLVRSVA